MTAQRSQPIVTVTAMLLILLGYAGVARAESVQWNRVYSGDFYASYGYNDPTYIYSFGWSYLLRMSNPNISITYHTRAVNDATGAPIACGSSVPQGTKVRFEFVPHVSDDIYWFATGYVNDSPYGDWGASATKPPVQCADKDMYYQFWVAQNTNAGPGKGCNNCYSRFYAQLPVDPPTKSITGLDGLSCTTGSDGVSRICTLQALGTVSATFNFAATNGRFYMSYDQDPTKPYAETCGDWGVLLDPSNVTQSAVTMSASREGFRGKDDYGNDNGDNGDGTTETPIFVTSVPAQSISCPITVGPASSGGPSAPAVAATYCTVGSPVAILFTSTDPNNRPIRYGVDWDADGSVDQWVPPSGYVSSGTQQSASRTYTTAGQKTIRVVAQNDQGALSPPTPYSFACNAGGIRCPIGYVEQNGQCVFSACPAGYMLQSGQCVLACTAACQGADIVNSCTYDVLQHCDWGCVGGRCNPTPAPTGDIGATPVLVPSGDTTSVSWTSQNATACTVTSTNGSSWTGLSSPGRTSLPILAQTIFSLHCTGYPGADPSYFDKSVTVNLIPNFQEL